VICGNRSSLVRFLLGGKWKSSPFSSLLMALISSDTAETFLMALKSSDTAENE
jgi:hypothetical protein